MNDSSTENGEKDLETIGIELVQLLQKNTNLSHSLCSKSVVDLIQHLSDNLPQLKNVTNDLIETIKVSILEDVDNNPDIISLKENLNVLYEIKGDLETGQKNFYELDRNIETCLENLAIIPVRLFPDLFSTILENHREIVVNLVDLYKFCSKNKQYCFKILHLIYEYVHVDRNLLNVLFNNTNFVEEICCGIKELLKLNDFSNLELSCRFLIIVLANVNELNLNFQDFLRDDDGEFLYSIFECIENDVYLHELNIFKDVERINRHNNKDTINDLLICILIAINKFYFVPNENILLISFFKYNSEKNSNCFLLETLLKFFNFEDEPLKCFKIDNLNRLNDANDYLITNSVIKLLNDIFSIPQHSFNIFYLNDFHVIIEIIIRKLSSLSCEDQVRMDYVSMIDLIIRNTDYINMDYRIEELKDCFKSILQEKIETYEQDIIKALIFSFPKLT